MAVLQATDACNTDLEGKSSALYATGLSPYNTGGENNNFWPYTYIDLPNRYPPQFIEAYPYAQPVSTTSFNITIKLDEEGVVYYLVLRYEVPLFFSVVGLLLKWVHERKLYFRLPGSLASGMSLSPQPKRPWFCFIWGAGTLAGNVPANRLWRTSSTVQRLPVDVAVRSPT